MTEAEDRARVVAEARSYLATPYHHAADLRGVGVDCAMILVRVFCDLGLVPPFDPRPYVKDWMMHREDERYMGFLLARTRRVEAPEPGDVVLFKIGRCFAHGGIVTAAKPLTMIHAYSRARCVVEEEVARNPDMGKREALFFSYWGG